MSTTSPSSVCPLVRLWDRDWNLCHVLIPADARKGAGGIYVVEYPIDHVVSRWISRLAPAEDPCAYMTVDGEDYRWSGRLHSWELYTPGTCPHCPHCAQPMMRSTWRHARTTALAKESPMDFGQALDALRDGKRLTRTGWNGHGMWLVLVPGSQFTVTADRPLGKADPALVGQSVSYRPHIDMRTADGQIVPWIASQSDLLASDWGIAG